MADARTVAGWFDSLSDREIRTVALHLLNRADDAVTAEVMDAINRERPQAGDIWADRDGAQWHVISLDPSRPRRLRLLQAGADYPRPRRLRTFTEVREDHGPLTLVRRAEQAEAVHRARQAHAARVQEQADRDADRLARCDDLDGDR